MAVRIVRRPKALEDAEAIADFIAEDSLEAAIRFLENAEATLKHLAGTPGIGGVFVTERLQITELRAFRVKGFPKHIIFFIEHADAIEVVRILHGSRDLESVLRDEV